MKTTLLTIEEYAQIEQTIAPQVLEKMSSWILKL